MSASYDIKRDNAPYHGGDARRVRDNAPYHGGDARRVRDNAPYHGDSGSVLLEFIIVLPIYMLLIGFAFVVGELSLETIHLAGSGDRTRAFSSEDHDIGQTGEKPFDKYRLAASPDRDAWGNGVETAFKYSYGEYGDTDMGVSERTSQYDNTESRVYVADENFSGPWTEMTAGMVEDSYTLPPWTRGLVAYWYRQKYNMTDEPARINTGSVNPVEQILSKGGSHRAPVKGKDLNRDSNAADSDDRRFGFYTLRRVVRRDGWTENPRLSYRTWGNGQLVSGGEWRKVVSELFSDANDASSYKGVDGKKRIGNPTPEWQGTDIPTYGRDGKLKGWSS